MPFSVFISLMILTPSMLRFAAPQNSVSTCRRLSSSPNASASPYAAYPALLTRTSMRPKCATVAAMAAPMEAEEVTSRASLRVLGLEGRNERTDEPLRAVATRRWVGWEEI